MERINPLFLGRYTRLLDQNKKTINFIQATVLREVGISLKPGQILIKGNNLFFGDLSSTQKNLIFLKKEKLSRIIHTKLP